MNERAKENRVITGVCYSQLVLEFISGKRKLTSEKRVDKKTREKRGREERGTAIRWKVNNTKSAGFLRIGAPGLNQTWEAMKKKRKKFLKGKKKLLKEEEAAHLWGENGAVRQKLHAGRAEEVETVKDGLVLCIHGSILPGGKKRTVREKGGGGKVRRGERNQKKKRWKEQGPQRGALR